MAAEKHYWNVKTTEIIICLPFAVPCWENIVTIKCCVSQYSKPLGTHVYLDLTIYFPCDLQTSRRKYFIFAAHEWAGKRPH